MRGCKVREWDRDGGLARLENIPRKNPKNGRRVRGGRREEKQENETTE